MYVMGNADTGEEDGWLTVTLLNNGAVMRWAGKGESKWRSWRRPRGKEEAGDREIAGEQRRIVHIQQTRSDQELGWGEYL